MNLVNRTGFYTAALRMFYCCLLIAVSVGLVFMSCASEPALPGVEINRVVENIDGEPVVPRDANTIYLQGIVNRTVKRGLPERLMIRIKESINIDGRLAVIPDVSKSDLKLNVIITGHQIQNLEFSDMGIPIKKRLRITAEIRLRNNVKEKYIFSNYTVQAFEEFSDMRPPIQSVMQVEENVISELAERISLKTIQGWYSERLTEIERNR